MKKIIFATGNEAKLRDARNALYDTGYEVIGEKIDFQEIQTLDQELIVKNKAKQAYEVTKSPLFVDDTGFYIENIPEFPGTMTKYINKTLGINGLSKLYDEGQKAHFKTLICMTDGEREVVVEGKLMGKLTKLRSLVFNPDTPINSIFVPDGFDKPLAEISDSLGIGNVHRKYALEKLSNELKKQDE